MWSSSEGQRINSFSIITVESNEQVKGIHQRMPVILTPEEENIWIGNTPLFKALDLLRPYTFDELSIKQVSRLVNSVKNDSEEILEVDE